MTAGTAPPPSRTVRISRGDVIALGRSGRPWDFLPVAAQVLKVAPKDAEVRFLAATALARLGLGTAARDHLDLLPAGIDADIAALRAAIDRLPADVVPSAELARTCRANADALAHRGIDLRGGLAHWESRAGQWQFLRSLDGNIVRRPPADRADMTGWIGLGDLAGAARAFAQAHFPPDAPPHPVTIEGIDPPWLLRELWTATPQRKDGARRRLVVVQAGEVEFLCGLALADLREIIADDRVSFFIGPGAGERLAADLRRRFDTRIAGPCVPLTTVRERVSPPIDAIIRDACEGQARELARLKAAAEAVDAGRDEAWWRERYRRALAGAPERPGGPHEPLRVLVPTCRYSTFIRHSSRDLVGAFERIGCDARLLIEPDDTSHFSALAYLRQFAEFRPDLVVLINYTRANMGQAAVAGVPWVTWVQDAMPHLYDPKIGAAQGPLDFLAGHLHRELFTRFAYPMERLLPAPVVADQAKFHPGPVAPDLLRRHECEVAFVSHHSETPEAMHARMLGEIGDNAGARRVCERMFPRVRDAVDAAMESCTLAAIERAAREEVQREFGDDPQALAMIQRLYGSAMADRLMRHQTLEWAAGACERNGWRLKVYGRGWDSHLRFGAYAAGELEHGEDLRASYQAATVHLHASVNTLVHQRVMECALSGGLPLCRMHRDALSGLYAWAQSAACRRAEPAFCELSHRMPGYHIADHPEFVSVLGQIQRLGIDNPLLGCLTQARIDVFRAEAARMDTESHAGWLLGDLSQTTFWSAATLEARIRRAIERPRWRRDVSEGIAARVRSRLTHDRLVERLLGMVRASLERAAATAMAA